MATGFFKDEDVHDQDNNWGNFSQDSLNNFQMSYPPLGLPSIGGLPSHTQQHNSSHMAGPRQHMPQHSIHTMHPSNDMHHLSHSLSNGSSAAGGRMYTGNSQVASMFPTESQVQAANVASGRGVQMMAPRKPSMPYMTSMPPLSQPPISQPLIRSSPFTPSDVKSEYESNASFSPMSTVSSLHMASSSTSETAKSLRQPPQPKGSLIPQRPGSAKLGQTSSTAMLFSPGSQASPTFGVTMAPSLSAPAGSTLDSLDQGQKRGLQPDSVSLSQWPSTTSSASLGGAPQSTKRRKSSLKEPWQPSEEDKLLLHLKDDKQLPWKQIATKFEEMGKGQHRVPALQMRLKRIKERLRYWSADDRLNHRPLAFQTKRGEGIRGEAKVGKRFQPNGRNGGRANPTEFMREEMERTPRPFPFQGHPQQQPERRWNEGQQSGYQGGPGGWRWQNDIRVSIA